MEWREFENDCCFFVGQVKDGICRKIGTSGRDIFEGNFIDDKLSGFGRFITH